MSTDVVVAALRECPPPSGHARLSAALSPTLARNSCQPGALPQTRPVNTEPRVEGGPPGGWPRASGVTLENLLQPGRTRVQLLVRHSVQRDVDRGAHLVHLGPIV